MKKSILVLAAIVSTGIMAEVSSAEARGLRIGLGFGVPFGRGHHIADTSILERAEQMKQRRQAAAKGAVEHRRNAAAAAARARAEQAAAAKAAQRQARIDAQAAAAAAKAKKRPAVAPTVAAVPAAAVPAALPAVISDEDKALLAAQDEQRAKADKMLQSLTHPAAAPATEPGRQAGVDVAPFDTGAPVSPAPARVAAPAAPAPVVAPVVAPVAAPAQIPTAKPVAGADCKRFIPGAGVTISVPCTE